MAHSIELLFDQDTDAGLRGIWDALDAAGVPSQNRNTSATNRPHVTVTVAHHIDAAVDVELTALADRLPLPCLVGAPLTFTSATSAPKRTNGRESASSSDQFVDLGSRKSQARFTLARLIVPSAALLELHQLIHRICAPHMTPGPAPHSVPGNWTAHATLGRRLSADQLAVAFATVPALEHPASFTGLRRWDGDQRIEHVLLD